MTTEQLASSICGERDEGAEGPGGAEASGGGARRC